MVKEALTPPPIVEETPSGGVAVTRQLKQSFIQVNMLNSAPNS